MINPAIEELAHDCKKYLAELGAPYDVCSRSHETLRDLYRKHGRAVVDHWLDDYWQRGQHNED